MSPTVRPTVAGQQLARRPAVFDLSIGTIAGRLSAEQRRGVATRIARPVRAWVEQGFLSGDLPGATYPRAFEGFAGGLKQTARRHQAVLTNAVLARRTVAVQPRRQRVRVDVLAPGGRPVGATARVDLRMRAKPRSGGAAVPVQVRARLFLTLDSGAWEIFGYDVDRRVGRTGPKPRGGTDR